MAKGDVEMVVTRQRGNEQRPVRGGTFFSDHAPDPMHAVLEEVRMARSLPSPKMARAIREAAQLSQDRVADALGVSRVCVSRWELGLRKPRRKNRAAWAALLAALSAQVNPS
jgi:DNA-binding transcriptional regulator YiaG